MSLPDALHWKYPNARIDCEWKEVTDNWIITYWEHPAVTQPTPQQCEAIEAEYEADQQGAPLTLEVVQQAKILELQTASTAEIHAGFWSSALGTPHFYDSEPHNQANILPALDVLRRLGGFIPWTCTTEEGIKNVCNHTAAQLQKVLDDGVIVNLQIRSKYRQLVNLVNAAETVAEVQTISWGFLETD